MTAVKKEQVISEVPVAAGTPRGSMSNASLNGASELKLHPKPFAQICLSSKRWLHLHEHD